MKIIRYQDSSGRINYAARMDDGSARELDGSPFDGATASARIADVKKLLAPIAPPLFLCTGLNYRKHADEGNLPHPKYPVLFMKTGGAVQNPGDPIQLPRQLQSQRVDYECELAVVINRRCKNVKRENAYDYVLGYTCANDVSARDWQNDWGGSQWCRGKTFDTFAPLGPVLVTQDEMINPAGSRIRTVLNGNVMQDWDTGDMIFDVPTLIEFMTGDTTVEAGTVILTGTPHGIGAAQKPPVFLKDGDTISVEIERIGTLTNPVLA